MSSFGLIPPRWLDWEPPGRCDIAALPAIGAVASIAGTGLSMMAASNEADYQAAVARNQAILDRQKANEEAAAGQRAAITESRKTQLAQSRARALAASSGTDAASPTQVDIEGEIAQQGGYNALSALYEGMAKARTSDYQAEIDLFKARRASSAGSLNATAALLGGVTRLSGSPTFLKLFGE